MLVINQVLKNKKEGFGSLFLFDKNLVECYDLRGLSAFVLNLSIYGEL